MTTVVRVLRFQEICIIAPQLLLLLLLLLLPLPLSRSSPCPTTVEEMIVSTTSDAERLAEALLCDGQAALTVSWNGEIMPSRTLHVSNGSTLNVTGSSENSADTIITSDGTVLLFQVDLESTVLLTGLTLFGGDGALRVTGGSFVEVINCSFTQNKRTSSDQGGAVYVHGSSFVALEGDTFFMDNTAIYGGAIYADDRSNVSFGGDALFDNNTATHGGAIYTIDSSELDVRKGGAVAFVGNQAVGSGGAIGLFAQGALNNYGAASFVSNEAGLGGAVYVHGSSVVVFESDTLIVNNTAIYGGAIYAIDRSELDVREEGHVAFVGNQAVDSGGAIYADDHSSVSSGGTTAFVNNTATDGGAVYTIDSSELDVRKGGAVAFVGNQAVGSGGGLALIEGSKGNIIGNVSFQINHAITSGGAIYADGHSNVSIGGYVDFDNNTATYGGAIYAMDSSELEVTEGGHVEFVYNNAVGSGGAVYADNHSSVSFGGKTDFVNNTATHGGALYTANSSELYVTEGGSVNFSYNNAGGYGGAIALFSQGDFNNHGNDASFVTNEAKFGGAAAVVDGSTIHVGGTASFVGNRATQNGGAIYASNASVVVETGARLERNVASIGSGGGVYASSAVIALTGATFLENQGARGGGVASSDSILDEETGGIGSSRITACDFDGNMATEGGAIYSAEGSNEVVDCSFTRNYAVVQGGAFLHSGTLVALTGCTFDSNMAGEDGLAVTIFGLVHNITDLTFRTNLFFCASGKYGLEGSGDEVEDLDHCRWNVVCSGCTTSQCDVPAGIDMDDSTVPVCEVVPEGVETEGNSGMTVETLDLMPGFYRTSNQSREVLECYREKACLGGSIAGSYCAKGYAGPYCAACDQEYGRRFQYSCYSCQGSDRWTAFGGTSIALVVVMIVTTFGVAYLVGVVDRPTSERSGMWNRRVSNFRDGLVRIIPLTAIKILLVSWQIITQFSSMVNAQYPPAYEKFLAALEVVNLNLDFILSLSCVISINFYARLTLVTIAPVAVLGVLAITYRVAMLRNGHSIRAKQMAKNKHLSAGLFLLFIVYSSVSYTIFQTFACDSLDSGVTYLRADYDLVCWTETHVAYMAYAGFMILVYPVGIPAVFAWALYINRDGIRRVAGSIDRIPVSPEPEAIKDLWAPYKRSRYYYEVIECGRRIALTGLAVFIYPGSTAQVAMETLLAVVFSSISEMLSPFAEPLDAWLYRSGTWAIFLNMYLALLLKMDNADDDNHSQDVFAGLLVAAHVGMVLIVIVNALLSALKGFREVRDVEMPVRTQEPFQYRPALIWKLPRNIRTTPAVSITPV